MIICSPSKQLGITSCSGFELLKGFFFPRFLCLCKDIGHIKTLLGYDTGYMPVRKQVNDFV